MDAQARRELVLRALRAPRGRYGIVRASQLSGVPRSTVYDWARDDVLVPDYPHASPLMWSYRDLVLLRLLARMRQSGVARAEAAADVDALRERLSQPGSDVTSVRIAQGLLVGDETVQIRTGQLAIEQILLLTGPFNLLEPIEGITKRPTWGPDLIEPSTHTYISPQVMGGEPCVESSRVPSASILALVETRSLSTDNVVRLYPQLTAEGVDDAVALERRMRRRQAA